MEDITIHELKERLTNKEELIIIDVREAYEHEEFNIGGDLIPIGKFPIVLPDLEKYKDQEIILYCRSGNRSGMAKRLMERAGFKQPRNLLGGMLAWQETFGKDKM